jgi:glycosyltransferase involved in cell wall biosynthesis
MVESSQTTKRVFIAWEPSNSRSATLAAEFDAESHNIHYLALKRPLLAPIKYVMQAAKTWKLLWSKRPGIVFVQNPPVFAPLAVWVYASLTGNDFIIDSHTGAFLENKWKWLSPLHGFVARRARVNIVTNDFLGDKVAAWGGEYITFPDVPVDVRVENEQVHEQDFVTVVNSFSYDEPLYEVLEAARALPEVSFAITGDVRRCPPDLYQSAPANVRFTGFIDRQDYVDMLGCSDAAVILTKENHTMQRGAYEAMSLGTPIITSDWPLLRDTFYLGTEHVDNSTPSIVAAAKKVLAAKDTYRQQVRQLKAERRRLWDEKAAVFRQSYLESKAEKQPISA